MFIDQAKEMIAQTNGRLFGVTFITKDERLRDMACRLGVQKGVKGIVDRKSEDAEHNVLTVFDFNADRKDNTEKGGFRRINFDTLTRLRINGFTYEIEHGN